MTAYYLTEAVEHDSLQVVARLDWRDARNHRTGQPDYVYKARREGAWTKVTLDTPAPEKATAVVMQLYLSNSPQGTVWWDDISLEQIAAPAPRKITVASINLKPSNTKSAAESVRQFLNATEASVHGKTDVNPVSRRNHGRGHRQVLRGRAESIPGPTTATLAELAKKRSSYVVAGIYEREGPAVYNTAVLLNRAGDVIGKYRKVYLPREEIEHGLTPGSDYPVFHTDFGTVGLMICYDVFFADPARNLASKGAEMILMPIWGGNQVLGQARAIENRIFLVASGYDYPTYVMDPDGEVLSLAAQRGEAAVATIDLNKRYTHPQLGDMRNRRAKELRVDVKQSLPGFVN